MKKGAGEAWGYAAARPPESLESRLAPHARACHELARVPVPVLAPAVTNGHSLPGTVWFWPVHDHLTI
jgi:hypothetical protein